MLNKEKYHDEIFEIACSGEMCALVGGKPVICDGDCFGCDCNDIPNLGCREQIKKWCNSEYVEPPVDWSKVAVDTPIMVRNNDATPWRRRHFAEYRHGEVYAWRCGETSWTSESGMHLCKYVRLATPEEIADHFREVTKKEEEG